MKKILSICIPTYNGGDRLIKLVRRILSSNTKEFEVVVSDNCSTDDTADKLLEIKDERLVINRNKENVGFYKNAVLALNRGTGKYLLLCNDIDVIYPEFIEEYIDILKVSNYGVLLNNGMYEGNNEIVDLNEGQSIYYIFLYSHPSYNAYLREAFGKVNVNEEIINNGYFNSLIGIEILDDGYGVALNNKIPIVSATEPEMYMRKKSRSLLGLSKTQQGKMDVSYTPKDQLIRFKKSYNYIVKYTNLMKEKNIGYLYSVFLELATINYFGFCMDSIMVHRYPSDEMIYNNEVDEFLSIPKVFFDEVKCFLEKDTENGYYSDDIMNWITQRTRLAFMNRIKSLSDDEYECNLKEIESLNTKLKEKDVDFL